MRYGLSRLGCFHVLLLLLRTDAALPVQAASEGLVSEHVNDFTWLVHNEGACLRVNVLGCTCDRN